MLDVTRDFGFENQDENELEMEKQKIEKLRCSFKHWNGNLELISFLGKGCFGACFLAKIRLKCGTHYFVVKYYFCQGTASQSDNIMNNINLIGNDDVVKSYYHKNIMPVLHTDYEENTKVEVLLKRNEILREIAPLEIIKKIGRGFIIMPQIQITLEDYLNNRKKDSKFLTNMQFCCILLGILEGVCHIHKKGICHRDLHLGNIFLSFPRNEPYQRIMIGDFGLSVDCGRRKYDQDRKFFIQREDSDFHKISENQLSTYNSYVQGGYGKYLPIEVREFEKGSNCLVLVKSDIFSVGRIAEEILDNYMIDPGKNSSVLRWRTYLRKIVSEMTANSYIERTDFPWAVQKIKNALKMLRIENGFTSSSSSSPSSKGGNKGGIQLVDPSHGPLDSSSQYRKIYFSITEQERLEHFRKKFVEYSFYFGDYEVNEIFPFKKIEDDPSRKKPELVEIANSTKESNLTTIVNPPNGTKEGFIDVKFREKLQKENYIGILENGYEYIIISDGNKQRKKRKLTKRMNHVKEEEEEDEGEEKYEVEFHSGNNSRSLVPKKKKGGTSLEGRSSNNKLMRRVIFRRRRKVRKKI